MGESERSARHLADDDLADEIVLYGDLVVAASESEERLTLPEIDKVLGLRDPLTASTEVAPH
jgi:hypothetical protein